MEEEPMFPGFERVMGNSMSLERNVEQHHIFWPMLQEILTYNAETWPAYYQVTVLQHLIKAMAPSFHQHLRQKISVSLRWGPLMGLLC